MPSHLVAWLHQNPLVRHRNNHGPGRPLHLFLTDRSGYQGQTQSWSEVTGSIRSRSLLSYGVDDGEVFFFIRFITGKGLDKEWNSMLICGHAKDKPVEIPPTVLRVTFGYMDLFCPVLFIIVPVYAETCDIYVNLRHIRECIGGLSD